MNKTFVPLLKGEAFAEYSPKVLSTDPWIVYFANFLSESEVQACENHLFFSGDREFEPSPAGNDRDDPDPDLPRHSETAFCTGECDTDETVQTVQRKASAITGVPIENFDFIQALRYKPGMYYREHHDNHPTFHYGPSGARIFTYFVYLSDSGLEGGATSFPKLGITAPAKRGAAVLFLNTKDRNPMETDPRTLHESLVVTNGEKRGLNIWLYQYNYRHFWGQNCASIELSDDLGTLGWAASYVIPKITVRHRSGSADAVHIFLALVENRGYADDYEPGHYYGAVSPGDSKLVRASDGGVLLFRTSRQGDVAWESYPEYAVGPEAIQQVDIESPRVVATDGRDEI